MLFFLSSRGSASATCGGVIHDRTPAGVCAGQLTCLAWGITIEEGGEEVAPTCNVFKTLQHRSLCFTPESHSSSRLPWGRQTVWYKGRALLEERSSEETKYKLFIRNRFCQVYGVGELQGTCINTTKRQDFSLPKLSRSS